MPDTVPALNPQEELKNAVFEEITPEEKGFAAIFETEIKPHLIEDVEKRRQAKAGMRQRLPAYLAVCLLSIIGAVAAFKVAFSNNSLVWLAQVSILAAIAIMLIGLFWWLAPGMVGYDSVPKTKAVGLVAARFGLTVDPEPASVSVLKGAFAQPGGGLFAVLGQRLAGKRGTAEFEAWPLVRYTPHKKHTEIFFSGWYLRLHLPVTVKSRTAVIERSAGYSLAGGLVGLQEVELESPEFKERFRVYSDDQVESRVILSPDVMAHVSKWEPSFTGRGGIIVGVSGDHAELALPTGQNRLFLWTPQIPATAVEELHGYFREIGRLLAFVDGFDALVESEGWRGQLQRRPAS